MVAPSHQFYLTCSLMTIFNKCDKYEISIGDKRYCGGLFANDIVLCAPTKSQIKKFFKNLRVSRLGIMKYNLVSINPIIHRH